MIDKEHLNDVIDFCYKYDIPYVGRQIEMFELIYKEKYDKFSNKHVAMKEIWSEFKSVYQAYWDKDLRKNLGYK